MPGENPKDGPGDDWPDPVEESDLPEADPDGEEPAGIWPSDGWDGDPDAEALADDDWGGLEDEALALPRGRVRVGLWERVLLEGVLDAPMVALMDTGVPRTRLVAVMEPLGPGRARVRVAGQWHEVAGAVGEEGELVLSVRVHLGGQVLPVLARVDASETEEADLRVGRDALSGHFVVDVAEAFLHGARGGPVRGAT